MKEKLATAMAEAISSVVPKLKEGLLGEVGTVVVVPVVVVISGPIAIGREWDWETEKETKN